MSATDQCEPSIIRALEKTGWRVTKRQYPIFYSQDRHALYVDLRLKHSSEMNRLMIVEIKCFAKPKLYLEDLYQALGQYQVYRMALRYLGIPDLVYLAIPKHIQDALFTEPVIFATLKETKVNYIVMDIEMDEVILWQTW